MSTFHAFEQAGWSEREVVAGYTAAFGELTTQAIPALLDAAGVGPDARVLDVATGPGYVAAAALARGARVTAVDFSPAMVAEARHRHPGLDVRSGDAQALPFAEASFDAVVTNFGMLHFAEPERALAEAHRVLAPGGRLAFTVWATPDKAIGLGLVAQALQAHGDPAAPLPPAGPAFSRFSDAAECRRVMAAAGFADAEVVEVAQTWRLASFDALWGALIQGTVRNRGALLAQPPDRVERIRTTLAEGVAPWRDRDGNLALPMPAVLTSARR